MFPVSCLPCKETLQIMCFSVCWRVCLSIEMDFMWLWIYRLTATTKQIKSRNKLKQQQQQKYDKWIKKIAITKQKTPPQNKSFIKYSKIIFFFYWLQGRGAELYIVLN